MIKTTRSRLEIRQEPDAASSLAGALIVAFGAMEFLISAAALAGAVIIGNTENAGVSVLRAVLGAAFFGAGWFFLRQRSRVVFDLDHRMVLQYIGVGGQRFDGNESHDLADFSAVVLTRQEQRGLLRRGHSSLAAAAGPRSAACIACPTPALPIGAAELAWPIARRSSDSASSP